MKHIIVIFVLIGMIGCESDKSKMIKLTAMRTELNSKIHSIRVGMRTPLESRQHFFDSAYLARLTMPLDYKDPNYFKNNDTANMFRDSNYAIRFRLKSIDNQRIEPYQTTLDSVNSLISHLKEINFAK